jgi:hypothetical protein
MAKTTVAAVLIVYFLLVAGAVADDGRFSLRFFFIVFVLASLFGLCAGGQRFDQGWD